MNPESLHKRIGSFIATKRDNLDMSQEMLAGRVGISRASLANIERGRQSILVHHLYAIAKELGLQPSDLLPPINNTKMDEALPFPSGLKPDQIQAVARMFATAPIDNRQTQTKEEAHGKPKKG